jgi:multidrug efflux pump subunit AcrA (membrane-fusion protein)
MKIFRLGIIILVLGSILLLTLSCSSGSTTTTAGTSIATAKQGTILTSVVGTGNLALENKSELSFGQTGLVSQATTVKVAAVNAVEGQVVEQGTVLVQADPADWQTKVTSAQHGLDSAKQSLLQAQYSLETAQYNLSAQSDVKAIQDKIDNTNIQIQQAELLKQESSRYGDSDGVKYWNQIISNLKENIVTYNSDLTTLLNDPAHSGAAKSVADIRSVQHSVDQAQAQVVNAQNNVDDAQSTLDDAKNSSQTIIAPFKGLITKVSVNVGDIVSRSTNLIEIAQPDKFVANILVTEIDVMSLSLNENATVSFNALTGLNFPAKIIKIAPLATISQGVVNYNVTVELTSTSPIFNRTAAGQTSSQTAVGKSPATTTPSFSGSQVGGSQSVTPPVTSFPRTNSTETQASGGRSMASITLKDGLSATVTIIIQEKDNVTILPSRAITRASGVSTVQLIKGTSTETRTVTTGLSDSSNTEITSGLNVGDQVLVKTSTATTSQFGGGGGFRIP